MGIKKTIINTGLEGFLLIDKIISISEAEIHGIRGFGRCPAYLCFESLAQLAAIHTRWLSGFESHAALLKINNLEISNELTAKGDYHLTGNLTGRTSRALSYRVKAVCNKDIALEGNILITRIDYDDIFKKDILKEHYRNLYSCLTV